MTLYGSSSQLCLFLSTTHIITIISNIHNMNTPKSSGIILGSDDVLVVLENVEFIFCLTLN